ncbi:hypothetical protein GCM10010440_51600 [Kitasatospora cinereorecta]
MIPVQELNSDQDFSRESDSGERIEAYIVTLVPECPAYAWYFAQSPVSAAADDPEPPDPELLEQAAVNARASTAEPASSRRRPGVTGVVNAVLLARACGYASSKTNDTALYR